MIFTEKQKGSRRKAQSCKEQLIVDSVVLKQARKKNRCFHMAYVDYRKAFDSMRHSWLLEILNKYKIDPLIMNSCKQAWHVGQRF